MPKVGFEAPSQSRDRDRQKEEITTICGGRPAEGASFLEQYGYSRNQLYLGRRTRVGFPRVDASDLA